LPSHTQWIKIALSIIFSLEITVLAVFCMYIAWLLTISTPEILRGIAMILGGTIGFMLSSVIYWRISVKFSEQRSAPR